MKCLPSSLILSKNNKKERKNKKHQKTSKNIKKHQKTSKNTKKHQETQIFGFWRGKKLIDGDSDRSVSSVILVKIIELHLKMNCTALRRSSRLAHKQRKILTESPLLTIAERDAFTVPINKIMDRLDQTTDISDRINLIIESYRTVMCFPDQVAYYPASRKSGLATINRLIAEVKRAKVRLCSSRVEVRLCAIRHQYRKFLRDCKKLPTWVS
jgi:hypothetical protein